MSFFPPPPRHIRKLRPRYVRGAPNVVASRVLTASGTHSRVKCRICILMGCYQVINAPVGMCYPRSELKGSLPNSFSFFFVTGRTGHFFRV
uniref:Uncharacterized protein n=1 Tax=Denticeps clupeoides TaxID=299321 RepID=A0AAY4A7M2_9TELE